MYKPITNGTKIGKKLCMNLYRPYNSMYIGLYIIKSLETLGNTRIFRIKSKSILLDYYIFYLIKLNK